MARPLRIEYLGALHHITARGNRKDEIYLGSSDRYKFLEILEKTVRRYNWICHAYCLMNNHYHLLIETPDANLSKGMRQLNGVYTQYFNRANDSVGHLFQGRFKSILVEKESYLLELCRYIVCNPVRANLCKEPKDWKWSSYNPTAYGRNVPDFLTSDWILSRFSAELTTARQLYMDFVQDGLSKSTSPLDKAVNHVIYDTDDFVTNLQTTMMQTGKLKDIPQEERQLIRRSLEKLLSATGAINKQHRNEEICRAHFEYGYKLKEIAEHLGLHHATISRIILKKKKM